MGKKTLKRIHNASLQAKIFSLILAVLVVVSASSFSWTRSALSDSLSKQVESRARALSTYVASRSIDPLLTNNIYALSELIEDTIENNEDVKYLFIIGQSGEVLVSAEKNRAISEELKSANTSAKKNGEYQENSTILDTEAGVILDTAAPIFKEGGAEVRVGMGYESVGSVITEVSSQLLVVVGIVLVAALALAYVIVKTTLRPVKNLVLLTEAVSDGELGQRAQGYNLDEIGKLAESFNHMLDDLQVAEAQQNDHVERLAEKEEILGMLLQKVISAQEGERKRIARELHDETSHSLTSMLIELQSIKNEGPLTKEQANRLSALKSLIDESLESIKQLAWNLRPNVLDKFGLKVSLERYAEEVEEHNEISVDLIVKGDTSAFPPDIEITIYRLVQEAITNVIKYAQANEVGIALVVNPELVSVMVEDDGVGFDVDKVFSSRPGEHLGLLGMDERVALLGGMLNIESSPGKGTTIIARVPIDRKDV